MQTFVGIILILLSLIGVIFLVWLFLSMNPKILENVLKTLKSGWQILMMALRTNPLESFLEKNYRTLALIVVLLLAFFVWPTLYKIEIVGPRQSIIVRQNRITGKIEHRYISGGAWKTTDY